MTSLKITLLYYCAVITFCSAQNENLVISITNGKIRGKEGQTIDKNSLYHAYQGIPYAKPPIGELRFAPPQKPDKWEGILDATQDKSQCVQGGFSPVGSEDCLYINIYVPITSTKTALSTLVWIHGGSFENGNASYAFYGPDYLLNDGVIFVSFNYRLGLFGFLSTEDLVAPGNWGLKDQVLALHWVQENIHFFGGNAEHVTIFGESAGSVSVSYLLQTSLTKGLYKGAIMESGSSLCVWALSRKSKELAIYIGNVVKANTKNSSTLVEGLRKLKAKDLEVASQLASTKFLAVAPLDGLPFAPVIEPPHDGAIVLYKSDELLSKGQFNKVPIITGVNSNEAAYVTDITGIMRPYLARFDLRPEDLTPYDLSRNQTVRKAVGNEIKKYYFDGKSIAKSSGSVIKFGSDDLFNRPAIQLATRMSQYVPIYFYVFDFNGQIIGKNNYPGVGHAQELQYIFRQAQHPLTSSSEISETDKLVRARMVRLWTNFAKTGNPTPTKDNLLLDGNWPTSNTRKGQTLYLLITDALNAFLNPFKDNMDFWFKIFTKYGNPPYGTY